MKNQSDAVNIEARRRLVLERYVDGTTMRQIAREFGVSVGTIHSDVAFCREQWREEMIHLVEGWKDRELDKIDRVEAAAWAGWERSLRESKKTVTERSRRGQNDNDKAKVEKQDRDGDPRFLKIMADCIEQRCKILGLHAPKKIDATSGGQTIKFISGVDEEKV